MVVVKRGELSSLHRGVVDATQLRNLVASYGTSAGRPLLEVIERAPDSCTVLVLHQFEIGADTVELDKGVIVLFPEAVDVIVRGIRRAMMALLAEEARIRAEGSTC
jgi:hypothetical protein